jgi:DNA-binding MarR family transcriptional regulator
MASSDKKQKVLAGSIYESDEASPGFLFWKAYNTWSRLIRLELESLNLTQVQYSILAAVNYLGSVGEYVSQQDVSNQLSMDKMMVSDVAKALEKRKLLIRKPHPNDGRAVCLHLTADARQKLKRAVPVVESADERFFGMLKRDQVKEFSTCLVELVKFPRSD